MDFFNTNSFALREDLYISWSSIYMPLNFFIAKFFIFEGCLHHANNGLALRGCALEQYAPLAALHFVSLALFAKKIKTDLNGNFWESIMIFFVLIFSLPALFLLERGNYLIVFNFFLGLLVNTNSEKIKIFLISLMINIKQYFLLPVFLLSKNLTFKAKILLLSSSLFLFLGSSYLINLDNPLVIIENMFKFSSSTAHAFEKLWFPTSLMSIYKAIDSHMQVINYQELYYLVKYLILFTYLLFVSFLIIKLKKIFLSKESIELKIFFGILFLLIVTDSIGGYGLVMLFPFIGRLYNLSDKFTFILVFLILIPFDFSFYPERLYSGIEYWSGSNIIVNTQITILSLFRPIVLIVLFFRIFELTYETKKHIY